MWWLVLLLFVAGGVWLCGRLRRLEDEIHAEIEHDKKVRRKEHESAATEEAPAETVTTEDVDVNVSLEDAIMKLIESSPGGSQAEVYAHFEHHGRSQLQKTLRDMARDGLIRRERKGSSYRLYPA